VAGSLSAGGTSAPADLRRQLIEAAPIEPEGLRVQLSAAACDDATGAPEQVGASLAAVLALSWSPILERAGAPAGYATEIIVGARRESWLWVMGERTWPHEIEILAGRIARRLAAG